ncbi:hypothetical protein ACWD6N_37670 [Micromonospora sp. NPDC005163]
MNAAPYDPKQGLQLVEAAFHDACERFVESRFDLLSSPGFDGDGIIWFPGVR